MSQGNLKKSTRNEKSVKKEDGEKYCEAEKMGINIVVVLAPGVGQKKSAKRRRLCQTWPANRKYRLPKEAAEDDHDENDVDDAGEEKRRWEAILSAGILEILTLMKNLTCMTRSEGK